MIKGFKVQIFPNKEQQNLMFKSFGTSRFAYNWALNKQIESKANGSGFIKDTDLRKQFTQFKKIKGNEWIGEVNNNVTKQAIKDLCNAYKKFMSGASKFPKFKSRKKSKMSFYNDTAKLQIGEYKVRIESIGWMDSSEQIPMNVKYLNPRVSFDGIRFWLSVNCEVNDTSNSEPKTEPIGIDMGLKTLMVCSNGKKYSKVNTHKERKKLKRLQRKASRHYDKMMKAKSSIKSKNLLKLETLIKKQHQRISNIRLNMIHQHTSSIIKLNPQAIVIEDLNVRGMMKNKHLSDKVADCSFYEIRRQLTYKCEWNNIQLIVADRWFPSSKLCSNCGNKKEKLSLSERVYHCECCDAKIDRDYNASLNLKHLAM